LCRALSGILFSRAGLDTGFVGNPPFGFGRGNGWEPYASRERVHPRRRLISNAYSAPYLNDTKHHP